MATTIPPKEPEKWLDKEANRDKLKMAGAAFAAVVVAGWAFFQWWLSRPTPPEPIPSPSPGSTSPPSPTPAPEIAVHYTVCTGEYERNCGFPHDVYLYCYADVAGYFKDKCLRTQVTQISSHDGNKCGYGNFSVLCTQNKP